MDLDFWANALWVVGALSFIGAIVCLVTDTGGFILLAIVGVIAIACGFGVRATFDNNQYEVKSAGEACVLENARELSSPASISTMKDDRVGPIYPCYFLLDEGIQPGIDGIFDPVPMKLSGGVDQAMFADQNFTAEGSFNAVLLFGKGSFDASQTTDRTQVVAFLAETSSGFANFLVGVNSVRYKECADECTPSVLVWTSQEPMFTKTLSDDEKDDSIWIPREDSSYSGSLAPGGTPVSPGQAVQALATRVVIQLPASMMPGAAPLNAN